jgi:MOSC domain-containing protein YiiM
MNDPKFVKTFLRSGRPGVYFRIVEDGALRVGDTIERIERGDTDVTVHEVWDLSFGEARDPGRLRTALRIPTLGPEWIKPMSAKLAG